MTVHQLLIAPSSAITLATVEDFVALGIPENLTVEYKRGGDKPAEAAAALANTYGGIILVGVAEGDSGIPKDIVGVDRKEKERLVNRMGTSYDPPWSPEVIEIPLRDSDKVVLVLRIDRDQVPAPIVMDGSILVRLDGRNVKANRQMMAALLAQADTGQAGGFQLAQASRSPGLHRPVISRTGTKQDLQLRAITSVPLPIVRRRIRLATGMPEKVITALSRTKLHPLTVGLARVLQSSDENVPTRWNITRATSREVVLALGPEGLTVEEQEDATAICQVVVALTDDRLEVIADVVLWQEGRRLSWDHVQLALITLAQAVGGVLLPEALTAIVGPITTSPPAVEIHVTTHRYGVPDRTVDAFVDVSSIGERPNVRKIRGANEFLDETLIENGDWAPAVIDALTSVAMDWGFPSPTFG
ncbi:ATP-binding protein [Streptomyces nodosus]